MRLPGSWASVKKLLGFRGAPAAGLSLALRFASRSEVGGRPENEDNCLVHVPAPGDATARRGWLAVVSDGMGGHNAGATASRLAVEEVCRSYYRSSAPPPQALQAAFFSANRLILKEGSANPALGGMGATCTAVVGVGSSLFLAHVGDSRLYFIRQAAIHQLTEDHSRAMGLVRRGLLSLQEARHHGDRHILLRALGRHDDVSVSAWESPLALIPGDRLLLCTDGLYELIDETELLHAATLPDCAAAADSLIGLAKERDAQDNITAVVLEVGGAAPDHQDAASFTPPNEVNL